MVGGLFLATPLVLRDAAATLFRPGLPPVVDSSSKWGSSPAFMNSERGQTSARDLINVIMRWYEDRDRNFVEQFQSSGFDARV